MSRILCKRSNKPLDVGVPKDTQLLAQRKVRVSPGFAKVLTTGVMLPVLNREIRPL